MLQAVCAVNAVSAAKLVSDNDNDVIDIDADGVDTVHSDNVQDDTETQEQEHTEPEVVNRA